MSWRAAALKFAGVRASSSAPRLSEDVISSHAKYLDRHSLGVAIEDGDMHIAHESRAPVRSTSKQNKPIARHINVRWCSEKSISLSFGGFNHSIAILNEPRIYVKISTILDGLLMHSTS